MLQKLAKSSREMGLKKATFLASHYYHIRKIAAKKMKKVQEKFGGIKIPLTFAPAFKNKAALLKRGRIK